MTAGLWCSALALVWLGVGTTLSAGGVEPVATFFFLFAWSGLILLFDGAIAHVEGRSLLARLGIGGVSLVVAWSTAWWFLFELANLRLANWHYVLVTDHDGLRLVGTALAFGTVLPGVLWLEHWLGCLGVASQIAGPRLVVTPARLTGLQVAGAISLLLCLADPTRFFPLIWGATALLLAPVNHRRGLDGWLAQWSRGDYGPTVRMLLAGAIAGGCWEFFNVWARARWIYTVPFFDELKLGEMPLLGFVGFPAFAIECACFYRWLVWQRLAPPFGAYVRRAPAVPAHTRLTAIAAAIVVSAAGYIAVDRVVVTSRTPRVVDVAPLSTAQREALGVARVTHLTQLVGRGSRTVWRRLDERLNERESASLRQIVALYLHQGIGTEYGNRLAAAGITRLGSLRGTSAEDLWHRLREIDAPGRAPSRAQVKVWLQRLPAVDPG